MGLILVMISRLLMDARNCDSIISAEILRIGSLLLSPVMPTKTKIVLNDLQCHDFDLTFGILKQKTKLDFSRNLFPRIL